MEERDYRVALSFIEGVGPVTYRTVLHRLQEKGLRVEEMFAQDQEFLATELKLRDRIAQSIASLGENLPGISETFDLLDEREIQVVLFDEEFYPKRLLKSMKDSAPPVLYCYGNLDLFSGPSAAVVGSREPDENGLPLARKAGAFLAKEGRVVVSGCARGVDTAAQMEAMDVGGTTIGVLAHGLLSTRSSDMIPESGDRSSCLLVSEFPPTQSWSAGSAMARNKTICALSDAVLVIQASARGGTLACGRSALKMPKPLFVISPQGDLPAWAGNATLVKEGGFPLEVDEYFSEIDFSPILDERVIRRMKGPEQETLF